MEFVNSNGEPLSPKKKVHCSKEKLGETVRSVRDNLKHAKDISARNLLTKGIDQLDSSSGSSTYEEVMVIEEEGTDYSEYVEEYVEESVSTDDSELEPLPPPIQIPKELQVKDSDEEGDVGSSSSDEDSDITLDSDDKQKNESHNAKLRPKKYRGLSCTLENSAKTEAADGPKAAPPMESCNETDDSSGNETEEKLTSIRPISTRGSSFLEDPQETKPVIEKHTQRMESFEEGPEEDQTPPSSPTADDRIAWRKPSWTTNRKLRSTGKSAAENLAKPITSLPHMKRPQVDDEEEDNKPAAIHSPKTPKKHVAPPAPSPKAVKPYASLPQTPTKSSKPTAVPLDNESDEPPKIEWEKPEWAKKKVLKATKKGQQLQQGQEIARPIRGIKPVDD